MSDGPIDALLLVSFGGPEQPDDVVPFLQNVTSGLAIPPERLEEVGQHYFLFGGRSPINDLNRELIAAVEEDLREHDIDIPVYWGNRNWQPYLRDVMEQMQTDGIRRAAYLVTSAYSSYSGCRQYRENLAEAVSGIDVELVRLRSYFNHPGFIGPFVQATRTALQNASEPAHVVFVTHSIPEAMNDASGPNGAGAYRMQHEEVSRLVAQGAGIEDWSLAYCSRSGSPATPWLEPDINDKLEELAQSDVTSVIVVPIGFVSDHMEVIYDLDTEASATAAELGLEFVRVATPAHSPEFVAMVRELLLERVQTGSSLQMQQRAVGICAPNPAICPADCCPNPRGRIPAVL